MITHHGHPWMEERSWRGRYTWYIVSLTLTWVSPTIWIFYSENIRTTCCGAQFVAAHFLISFFKFRIGRHPSRRVLKILFNFEVTIPHLWHFHMPCAVFRNTVLYYHAFEAGLTKRTFLDENQRMDVHFVRPSVDVVRTSARVRIYPANADSPADKFLLSTDASLRPQ